MILNILEDKFYSQLDNICQNALTTTDFMESQGIGLSGIFGEKTEPTIPRVFREANHCSKEFIKEELLNINRHIKTHCLKIEDAVKYLEVKNKEYYRGFEAERLGNYTELFTNNYGHTPKKYNANYIALRIYIAEVLFEIERLSYNKEPIVIKSESQILDTNSFFELVFSGEIGDLEIFNYVQKVTNNHEIEKLKLLSRDLDFYIFMKKEDIEGELSEDEINEKIEKNISNGIEVPYMRIKPLMSFMKDQNVSEYKFVDLEKLMYPYDFFTMYKLTNLLNELIQKKSQLEQDSLNSNSLNYQTKSSLNRKKNERKTILNLEEAKAKKLFKFLHSNKFISFNTKEIDMVSVLSKNGNITNKIEWIDKAIKQKNTTTVQTLFQLIQSFNIELKGSYNALNKDVRNFILDNFSNDFGNIQSKFNGYKPLNTTRKTLIDDFIKSLILS